MTNFKFFNNREELVTGCCYDTMTNDDIGDLIGFTEKVQELEQDGKLTFTKEMDRDRELADLFRLCMANYQKGAMQYSFTEYTEEVLLRLEEESKKPIMVIECCPYCGEEIQMNVPRDTHKLNFCPHCGHADIYLCSECEEEIHGCNPGNTCAYCYGYNKINKNK